jgi:antitoxin (DNA-binding transcriptional repressor) of toxin-antitoxin stability system
MADWVTVDSAQTDLVHLLERVGAGEEITLVRGGKPVATLVPRTRRQLRRPGIWKGRVVIAADFDEIDAEIADLFER